MTIARRGRSALLLLLAAAAACRPPAAADRAPRQVHFAAMNDWHGALQPRPAGPGLGQPFVGGLSYLAAAVDDARAQRPGLTLLDGGDCFQGDAAINESKGMGAIEALGLLGVKAAAVGNHEFDYGGPKGGHKRAYLEAAAKTAPYPLLSANIEALQPDGSYAPYRPENILGEVILDVKAADGSPVRVGVYGLSTVTTPTTTRPDNVDDLRFGDLVEASQRSLAKLRAEGAEITVLVGHIGGACPPLEGAAHGLVAHQACLPDGEVGALLTGLGDEAPDLMVLGHSHTMLAHQQGKTALVEAASYGAALGLLSLGLGPGGVEPSANQIAPLLPIAHAAPPARCGAAPSGAPLVVDGRALQPKAEAEALTARLESAVEGGCAPAGCSLTGLERHKARPSPLGQFTAAALQNSFKDADLGLQNGGGLRADLPPGPLMSVDWQQVMPFDNKAVLIEITGAQLLGVLREGARGRHSFLQVTGASYTIDPSRPAEDRICEGVLVGGQPLDPAKTYRVATSDFLASGGDHLGEVYGSPKVLAEGGLLRDIFINASAAAGPACVAPPAPTVRVGPCGAPAR